MKIDEAIKAIESCPVLSSGACKNVEDGICGYCDIGEAIDSLKQTALAYREMLERLEFADHSDVGGWKCCPVCGVGINDRNHSSDCELSALLKESEG